MPVFHFVFRAYGTWHPDHALGWNQHGARGRLQKHIGLGFYRRDIQSQAPVEFCRGAQQALVNMAEYACRQRGIRCHAVVATSTHMHLVASWFSGHEAPSLYQTLKRLLGLRAGEVYRVRGRRWFSHGGRPKRVADAEHLSWLMRRYLPKQGGVLWKEGDEVLAWGPVEVALIARVCAREL